METPGLKLNKYSIGVGDRFAQQAEAQLKACIKALECGVEVIPVWNKSNREHNIIGSEPSAVRQQADRAVKALDWQLPYYCDADHITAQTVERFLTPCDFFTFDVADFIGQPAATSEIEAFIRNHPEIKGSIELAGADETLEITPEHLRQTTEKFLGAVKKAGEVHRRVLFAKGAGNFISEVSMDETDRAQSPVELLIILAAIADEGIPVQTIAPKFSGRFNKGVDFVGHVAQFEREMALDITAIAYAIRQYGLPENLKLSVHSGSDKFSIYPAIHANMQRFDVGVHVKTAGTTWLEELIGLAEAGGEGLALAKDIYGEALAHLEELCVPYATVIDIDPAKLPSAETVRGWTSEQFTSALRHVEGDPAYNSSLRQLLHVGFKVAAKMGSRYLELVKANEAVIARNVTENLFNRHVAPVFLGARI